MNTLRVVRLPGLALALFICGISLSKTAGGASPAAVPRHWKQAHCLKGVSANALACSPDGRRLLSVGNRTMRLWDADSGTLIRTFEARYGPDWGRGLKPGWPSFAVAFSPDGTRALTDGICTALLWDVKTGLAIQCFRGHKWQVHSVAFCDGGRKVVTGSSDGTVRIWNVEDGKEVHRVGTPLPLNVPRGKPVTKIYSLAVSPDGHRVLSGAAIGQMAWPGHHAKQAGGRIQLLTMTGTGSSVQTFSGVTESVGCVAFSPDNQHAVSSDWSKTAFLWDAGTGQIVGRFEGHTRFVSGLAFLGGGKALVSGSFDGTIRLWNTANGEEIGRVTGHVSPVMCVCTSPDGKRIFSTSRDRTVRIWEPGLTAQKKLLVRYAPVLWFHDDEQFRPTGVGLYLGNTRIGNRVTKNALADSARPGSETHMDVVDHQPNDGPDDYAAWYNKINPEGSRVHIVYARAKEFESIGETKYVTAQYWFFYVCDGKDISPHEGEWEMVEVVWEASTAKDVLENDTRPLFTAFAQHYRGMGLPGGERVAWANTGRHEKIGETHPVVYVAHNSHASYPNEGLTSSLPHWVDHRGRGARLDPQDAGLGNAADRTYVLAFWPDIADESLTRYEGQWGESSKLGIAPRGPRFADDGEKFAHPARWGFSLPERNED